MQHQEAKLAAANARIAELEKDAANILGALIVRAGGEVRLRASEIVTLKRCVLVRFDDPATGDLIYRVQRIDATSGKEKP